MEKEKKNLKVFGYGLSLIITLIVIRHGIKYAFGLLSWAWLALAVILFCLTTFKLEALKPFYNKWMKVAHVIGTLITGLILSILFYCVFAPVGLLFRILRKDMLNEHIEPEKGSYWEKREGSPFDKSTYHKQF